MTHDARTWTVKLEKLNESKAVCVFILICMFLGMLALNYMTFYRSDEFVFLVQIRDTNGSSVFDTALKCTVSMYENISSRLNLFWMFIFLQLDKIVFDVFNSVFYVLLICLIQAHILGNFKANNILLVCVAGMVWFFVSDFGNVILWSAASTIYLWTVVFGLLLLLPLRIHYHTNLEKKQNLLLLIPIVPLSVLSAGGMETIGGTVLLINLMFIIFLVFKKRHVPVWSVISAVTTFITVCVSVFSPGTRNKSTLIPNSSALIETAKRIYLQIYNINEYFILIIVIMFFVFMLYATYGTISNYKSTQPKNIINNLTQMDQNTLLILIFLIASLVSEGALLLSPYIAGRQNIFTICCIIIAVGIAGVNLDKSIKFISKCKLPLLCVLVLLCVIGYTDTFAQTYNAYAMQKTNISDIESKKEQGIFDDIEIRYTLRTNSHMAYSEGDLSNYGWISEGFCDYYGINSFKLVPNDAY